MNHQGVARKSTDQIVIFKFVNKRINRRTSVMMCGPYCGGPDDCYCFLQRTSSLFKFEVCTFSVKVTLSEQESKRCRSSTAGVYCELFNLRICIGHTSDMLYSIQTVDSKVCRLQNSLHFGHKIIERESPEESPY